MTWIEDHAGWLALFSFATLIGSVLLLPPVVTRLPTDYFARPEPPPDG